MHISIRKLARAAGLPPTTAWKVMRGLASEATARRALPRLQHELQRLGLDGDEMIQLKEDEMPEKRHTLTLSACKFFGLRHDPFFLPPQARQEAWWSQDLTNVYDRVVTAARRQGFLALVGVAGAGKTELRKRLMDDARRSGGRLVLIWPEYADMRRVSVGMIYAAILRTFGQSPARDLELRERQLRQLLEAKAADGVSVALCYEDAHDLDDRVLRAQKRFWELGDGGYERWLGVIMFGQPALEARLEDYRFSEIAQRVQVVAMPALTAETGWAYVAHRFGLQGVDAATVIRPDVVERLVASGLNTPLGLGNGCVRAMAEAWMLGERQVTAEATTTAARVLARRAG